MTDSTPRPRVILIHALEESVGPARAAFKVDWPEAEVFDLLDTSLAVDLAHAGRLDDSMLERFIALADYARRFPGKGGETAAILFTCSAFGPAIDAVKQRLDIPVLRPNESAFALGLATAQRIGLIVSFEPSLAPLRSELQSMAAQLGKSIEISAVVAEGALAALKAGDRDEHDRHVLAAAKTFADVDCIILGQFSLARATALLQSALEVPVVSTPAAAVAALKVSCAHAMDREKDHQAIRNS